MTLILAPRNSNHDDDNVDDREQAAFDKAFADVVDGEVVGQFTSKLSALGQTAKKAPITVTQAPGHCRRTAAVHGC